MDLPSTFKYKGWTIKYRFDPGNNTNSQKAVVFVHGTPWSSIVYQPFIEALASKQTHQILVYDLPGYGQSQNYDMQQASENISSKGFDGDTSVKFQAEALTALLVHHRLDGQEGRQKPAVVAHDIAGAIVLRTHLIHNIDFDRMFFADTNTVLPWGDGFYKLVRDQPQPFLQLPPNIFAAVVRAVIQSACHDTNVLKLGWEDRLAEPWLEHGETSQKSFVRQIAQANDQDVQEMLSQDMYGRVRCDVKIVWGESDRWIPKHKIEELEQKLQGRAKEVVFIPRAGHLVMIDQPVRFAYELFEWLG